jgi:hypothetical protein
MNETTPTTEQLDQFLRERLAALMPTAAAGLAGAPGPYMQPGFGTALPAQVPAPSAILLRLSVPLPDGREASAYLAFDVPESLRHPAGVQQLVAALAATWPIQTFEPRGGGWGGGRGYGTGWGGPRGNGYYRGGRGWR